MNAIFAVIIQPNFNETIAERGSWKELKDDIRRTLFQESGLSLKNGAKYSTRVGAINRAGFVFASETNGVIVDTTKPLVSE